MANRHSKGGFYIDVTCPGCGGRLELQEDFFVLRCAHCGSVLRVAMPNTPPAYVIAARKEKREIRFHLDRHLKQEKQPLTTSDFSVERIYYPYWKISALMLKIIEEQQQQPQTETANLMSTKLDYVGAFQNGRMVGAYLTSQSRDGAWGEKIVTANVTPYLNTQMAGPELEGIPFSLGLRTEYIKLTPYSEETIDSEFAYLPVTKQWDNVLAVVNKSVQPRGVSGADSRHTRQQMIFQPEGAVVYFPYFVCQSGKSRYVVDAVSGRVVHTSDRRDESFDGSAADSPLTFGQLGVDFHRCLTCGDDLPAAPSHVYICNNCQTVTALEPESRPTGGILSAVGKSSKDDPLFPFWMFKVTPDTIKTIANPVTGRQPEWLLAPAFRIANFKAHQQLIQRMTSSFPQVSTEPVEAFDKRFWPVDLSMSEARVTAEMSIFCVRAKNNPRLSADSVRLSPMETALVYIPFHAQNYFYIDSIMDTVTFAKSTVA